MKNLPVIYIFMGGWVGIGSTLAATPNMSVEILQPFEAKILVKF